MVVKEGNLITYDSVRESKNTNYIKNRFLKEFESVYPKLTFLKDKITSILEIGREEYLVGKCACFNLAVHEYIDPEYFHNHMSCYRSKIKTGVVTRKNAKTSGIPNSDIKHCFKNLDKNSPAMKFFTENECPVCITSYKEILEENNHIVVPCCGHPVCCVCCDEIMRNDAKCSRCRGVFFNFGFDTMKFDVNLEILPHLTRIFY